MDAGTVTEGRKGISGCTLKLIALGTMLIDHTGAAILERMLWGGGTAHENLYSLYVVLRVIGRMAFPIYCFLLVEGFFHTRSRAKYALRLLVFACLSEVPFDMAFNKSFFDLHYNNVFFTLAIGVLTMTAAHRLREKATEGKPDKKLPVLANIGMLLIFLAGCALAEVMRTDYGACGVLAILCFYVFRKHRETALALAVFELAFFSSSLEFAALFMVIPLHFYNGERGRQLKYLFYAAYPVHLLILSMICYALGLGI